MRKPNTFNPQLDERWFIAGLLGIACVLFAVLVWLPENLLIFALLITASLPLVAMMFLPGMQGRILVLLIALTPLIGIVKGLTGIRYAPLLFDLAILAICGLHVAKQILQRTLRLSWIDVVFVGFVGLAFIQMFNPNVPGPQAAIEGFRKFAYMSIAFYAGRSILKIREFTWLAQLILIISALLGLYAIKQFFWPSALDFRIIDLASASEVTYLMGGQLRPFATLPGPFHLGLYLIIAGTFVVDRLLYQRLRLWETLFLLGLLALQMIALIMTRTKSNWVGMGVSVALLVFLTGSIGAFFRLRLRLRQLLTTTIVVIVAIVVMSGLIVSGQSSVIDDALDAVLDPLNAPTFVYRMQLWEEYMFPAMRDRPIIGWGTSAAGEGLSHLYLDVPGKYFFASHNLYFKIMLELGLFGLILFTLLIGMSLKRGWQTLHTYQRTHQETLDQHSHAIVRWAFAVVIGFLIAGLAAPVLDAYPANYYFWLLLGVLAQAPRASVPKPVQPRAIP